MAKKFKKIRKEQRRAKIAKVKGKIKSSVKKAVSVMAKTMKFAVLAPLLPLKVAMGVMLKKKGVTPKKNIEELIPQFHKIIILKQSVSFDVIDTAISLVVKMIPPIIGFFKEMKKKKDSGAPMTPEEEEALKVAEQVADAIEDKDTDKDTDKDEKKGFDVKKYIPLAVIGIVAIWFFTKK